MMEKTKNEIQIGLCGKDGNPFANTENWHKKCDCTPEIVAETYEGKALSWSNGREWGEIHHPQLGKVMTYWKEGTPCYSTYTSPIVDVDGCIVTYKFDQDEGCWEEGSIDLGYYNGIDTCKFGY